MEFGDGVGKWWLGKIIFVPPQTAVKGLLRKSLGFDNTSEYRLDYRL